MKKRFRTVSALIMILALTLVYAAVPAFAATAPSINYIGKMSNDTDLVMVGKLSNPDNDFYSCATALDYDKDLFTVNVDDIKAKSNDIKIIKKEVDPTNGHIRVDFAFLDDNGGGRKATNDILDAIEITAKLKDGKTKSDIKTNSVHISDDDAYVNSLGSSYSGGPVTMYCSKDKTDDTNTKFGSKDSSASGTVTIEEASPAVTVPVKDISVTPTGIDSLPVGRTKQLTATISPADASNKGVKWESKDPTIATVDQNGVVKGVKVGSTMIIARSAENNDIYGSTNVVVTAKVIDKMDDVTATTKVGTYPILPTSVPVTYSDGTTGTAPVKWESIPSSDYSKAGTITVYGTVEGATDKVKCTVTVKAASAGDGSNNGGTKTGDDVRTLIIMGVLLFASFIAIIAVVIARKNSSKK